MRAGWVARAWRTEGVWEGTSGCYAAELASHDAVNYCSQRRVRARCCSGRAAYEALQRHVVRKAEVGRDRLQRPVDDAEVVAEEEGAEAGRGDGGVDGRGAARRARGAPTRQLIGRRRAAPGEPCASAGAIARTHARAARLPSRSQACGTPRRSGTGGAAAGGQVRTPRGGKRAPWSRRARRATLPHTASEHVTRERAYITTLDGSPVDLPDTACSCRGLRRGRSCAADSRGVHPRRCAALPGRRCSAPRGPQHNPVVTERLAPQRRAHVTTMLGSATRCGAPARRGERASRGANQSAADARFLKRRPLSFGHLLVARTNAGSDGPQAARS